VIQAVYDQQREMLLKRFRRVAGRIVSLQQPHVRPIVRGKAGREIEFGAKLTTGMENGCTGLERLFWDTYSEAGDLPVICERFRERIGHYPEVVLADKLLRNRPDCQPDPLDAGAGMAFIWVRERLFYPPQVGARAQESFFNYSLASGGRPPLHYPRRTDSPADVICNTEMFLKCQTGGNFSGKPLLQSLIDIHLGPHHAVRVPS
jgi:hypothetical protein